MSEETDFRVLLVEDDESDQLLLQEAADLSGLPCTLQTSKDGVEALAALTHAGSVSPHLVLLDLNMPRMNGLELLLRIRASPTLRGLPVVMLTNSNANDDVTRCYAAGASAYVCKSMDLERFFDTVRVTLAYWHQVAILPQADPSRRGP